MSTANFHYPNTSRHFAIGLEGEVDEWYYDDVIENVRYALDDIRYKGVDGGREDKWIGRDHQAIYRFDFEVFDHAEKEWVYPTLYVTITSGYYAGAIFDIDQGDFEGLELSNTNEKLFEKVWDSIEAVLADYSTPLVRVATFSNGEAIYEKATKKAVVKSVVNGYGR